MFALATVTPPSLRTSRGSSPSLAVATTPAKRHVWGKLGVAVEITLTANLLATKKVSYREGTATFVGLSDDEVLGEASFSLLQTMARGRYDDESYVAALDEWSVEAYHFACQLQRHFSPIRDVFDAGRSVVQLQGCDLLYRPRLKERGLQIGIELMKLLQRTYGVALFTFNHFMMPDPLICFVEDAANGQGLGTSLESERLRLKSMYEQHWGAIELDEGVMFCSPRNVFDYDAKEDSWYFVGPYKP